MWFVVVDIICPAMNDYDLGTYGYISITSMSSDVLYSIPTNANIDQFSTNTSIC